MKPFNLTPDPRILVVLTHTAMKPIDALCELIDNSIDSFVGNNNEIGNEIHIKLPTQGELTNIGGDPFLRISDNGPGMTRDEAQKALTAGYSDKNPFDHMGLFGVGFNIATGKFASKTRLITATKDDSSALVIDVDLNALVAQGKFEAHPREVSKSVYFPDKNGSGTIIELSHRWPSANVNHDFPKRLIQNGPGKVLERIGRRYASCLRHDSPLKFNIFVSGKRCEPFEHCAWGSNRSVPYGTKRINAKEILDHPLGRKEHCQECGAPIEGEQCIVNNLHSGSIFVEERVWGWIGVQRYDHSTHYGIDLIRNGRAIRILEQDAFFTFTDDEGNTIRDYQIDGIHGRIIGEVHLDHVPVNFTKQDFERATPEWQEAMTFLRGNSSLQKKKSGADENNSPMMRIYTGFRRVRKAGETDLYMAERKPDGSIGRIDRKEEEKFLERFNDKEDGYYDDTKWYERVIISEDEEEYKDCLNPECSAQNLSSVEICQVCDWLLKFKNCIKCDKKIRQSAEQCQHCGVSQLPEGPWKCDFCRHTGNPADASQCRVCDEMKGAVNPFDSKTLLQNSTKDQDLCKEIEIELADGGLSQRFSLEVRNASLRKGSLHLPSITYTDRTTQKLTLFLDRKHSLFTRLRVPPQYIAAQAAAYFISPDFVHLFGTPKHEYSLTGLTHKILEKYWEQHLTDDADQVRRDIEALFGDVQEKMMEPLRESADVIFNDMPTDHKQKMLSIMQEEGVDVGDMGTLRSSGKFMDYIPPDAVVNIFDAYTSHFFGENVWKTSWAIPEVPDDAHQKQLRRIYHNCLEDCAVFLNYTRPPPIAIRRARLSLQFLVKDFVK